LIGSVTRVRNNLAYATHLFFQQRGFLYIHTPIITASDCEGAGQMFQVTTILPEPHAPLGKVPTLETFVEYKDGKAPAEEVKEIKEKSKKAQKKEKKA
jgi:asparaginyl-tRNA synthetase